jgi:hypothetical protein
MGEQSIVRLAFPVVLTAAVGLLAVSAQASRIEVFPGPGTPIQDAIDAAHPGDRIVLHAGAYDEPVVVDKPLQLTTEPDASVALGPGADVPGVLQLRADDVSVTVGRRATLTISGGSVAAVLVEHVTGVTLRGIEASGGNQGLEVRDAARVTIRDCNLSGARTGVHLADIAPGARVTVAGGFAFGSVSGALLDEVAPGAGLGRSGVSIKGAFVTGGCGGVSVRLVDADGVALRRNRIAGSIGCIASIDVDASSANNRITRNDIGPGAVDAGSGNCWRNNAGTGLPTTCP